MDFVKGKTNSSYNSCDATTVRQEREKMEKERGKGGEDRADIISSLPLAVICPG